MICMYCGLQFCVCLRVQHRLQSHELFGVCVHHILYDKQLTERQRLTLDYFHTEKAALGLTARANRVLTGC